MIKLQIKFETPGYAQGNYLIKAKGFILGVLSWADEHGALNDWGNFAYIPIDTAGNGSFYYSGLRAIPSNATHVLARCFSGDFLSYEDVMSEIPSHFLSNIQENNQNNQDNQYFSVLTDLHLASKTWKIKQALKAAQNKIIFLLGDSTNDGYHEQFEQFKNCISETLNEKIIFPVIGNHDVLHSTISLSDDGCKNYADFQKYLLNKAEKSGFKIEYDNDSLAYSVRIGNIDLIALQCVISERKFLFPEGKQILWLDNHLKNDNNWHIILCHAPLLAHNPHRNDGNPYLNKNKQLQEIIDNNQKIIFLSGHTHTSPNLLKGNCDFDKLHKNIYLDCGSAVITDTTSEKSIMSPDWNDGCVTELALNQNNLEISMKSIKTGLKFPRGYYRFKIL